MSRRLAPVLALCVLGPAGPAAAQQPRPSATPEAPLVQVVRAAPQSPAELRERLQAAWSTRDAVSYTHLTLATNREV